MSTEYSTFVNNPDRLPQGQEINLAIRELTPGPRKYDQRIVKAILSRSPEKGGDVLRLRSLVGIPFPEPWGIKIVEELGESIPRPPYQGVIQVTEALNEGLKLE